MITFPLRLNVGAASQYLKEVWGIDMATKTLRNRTCQGTGPQWMYWGCRPYTTTALLDEWVEANFADVPANGHRVEPQNCQGFQAEAVECVPVSHGEAKPNTKDVRQAGRPEKVV